MREIKVRIIGFINSLLLTLAAYVMIVFSSLFSANQVFLVIFSFALLQSIVQLLCFINVWKEKGILWNLLIFLATVSILFIVIFFSIWIMNHLNYNMMLH